MAPTTTPTTPARGGGGNDDAGAPSSPHRCRRFESRVAIVTAATAGIGLAIARRLLQEGARGVAICSRRAANVAAAVAELEGVARAANPGEDGGARVLGRVCHVADPQQRAELLAAALAKFGGELDALVLNAAANPVAGPLLATPGEALDKLWQVNVKSALLMAGECAPALARTAARRRAGAAAELRALGEEEGGSPGGGGGGGGGADGAGSGGGGDPTGRLEALRAAAAGATSAMLFISSVTAFRPPFPIAAYAITKTTLLGVVRALADELGPQGVRVVGLAPGIVKTKFAAALVEGEGAERRQAAATALGRLGMPGDMAGAAAFLLSEDAAYVTGETLVASGGMQSRL